MAPILKSLLALITFAPLVLGDISGRSLKIRDTGSDAEVAGKYIVVFKEDTNLTTVAEHFETARSLVKRDGEPVEVDAEYDFESFKAYAVSADDAAIEEIAASDEVDYIEPDQITKVSAIVSQLGAPAGLNRLSSRTRGATSYRYDDSAGANTWVYVLDTGIRTTHSQFGGRASFGTSYVSGQTADGHGHGTHVAGTVGGSTYGVAKKTNLISVKVLADNGEGLNSYVLSALQWVVNNARTNNRLTRSVANLSLGSPVSSAVNSAARAAYDAGVTVVVAAGNENQLASNSSPASEASAITVGAIDSTDSRGIWSGGAASNYGAAVDIFAYGTNVLSAGISSDTDSRYSTGTSMAAPHVAGLAAYLISLENLASPSAVWNRILALATTGVVTNLNGSPNRLAYNGVA